MTNLNFTPVYAVSWVQTLFSILNEQITSESVYNIDIMGESVLNNLIDLRCSYSGDILNRKITYSGYVLKVEYW